MLIAIYYYRWRFYLAGGLLQILPGIVVLAAVVSAYPVEYDDLTHFAPSPVQYQQAAPLVKHLVVEKYVSWKCKRLTLLDAKKYITFSDCNLHTKYLTLSIV